MDAEIFSWPRLRRVQPGWSYQFDMGDKGPGIKMRFGGDEVLDLQMPWDDFGWYVPALWPFLVLKSIAVAGAQ